MGDTQVPSGNPLYNEIDDLPNGAQQYVPIDHASIYTDATGGVITMAATAAVKVLGSTAATSGTFAAGQAEKGAVITVDTAAGTFTVDKDGIYRLWENGSITGEADEDVTLEWQKGGTNQGEPHERSIAMGTDADHLEIPFSGESYIELKSGDVMGLGVLGSNSEVITFKRFSWGVTLHQATRLY